MPYTQGSDSTSAAPNPIETTANTGRRRRRALRAAVVSLGLVVVLAATGATAAEIYYRQRVEGCVAADVQQELGSRVSVRFGPRPLLLTKIDHRITSAVVDSADTRFGPAIDMRVHAQLNDIELDDSGHTATVGTSSAEATWSNAGIAKTLHGSASSVTSSPDTGTIDVTMVGGFAHLELRPHVVDHTIQVDTVSTRGLPTDLVDSVIDLITQSLQSYPLDMRADDLRVTDTGIVVALTGGRTTLQGSGDTC